MKIGYYSAQDRILKYQFCHANALFDSRFYHRKILKK